MIDYYTLYKNAKTLTELKNKDEKVKMLAKIRKKLAITPINLFELMNDFKKIDLIYENKKISPKLTLENLREANYNLFNAVLFLAYYPNRSDLYINKEAEHYAAIVPIFMASHKKYNDIPYEHWEKDPIYIRYFIGLRLWKDIENYLKPTLIDDNVLEWRKEIFESSTMKNKSYASYITKSVPSVKDVPLNVRLIKGQFWLANVTKRNEYMILDTVNWDNMPEAFDIVSEQGEKEVLPW